RHGRARRAGASARIASRSRRPTPQAGCRRWCGPRDAARADWHRSSVHRARLARDRSRHGARPRPRGTARMMAESLLVADHVTVQFGGNRALSDVDVDARAGEVTGLIGPNGAGKTTLFNVITGLQSPTAGRIRFDGRDVSR